MEKPVLSVILVAYNISSYTRQCVGVLREVLAGVSHEILVIDNGSTDDTYSWLMEQQDLRVIRNEENRGLATAWNQGMEMAEGEQEFLLLHNDAVLSRNAYQKLHEALWSRDDVGAVGPCTNSCHYMVQQGIGNVTPYRDLSGMQRFAEFLEREEWPSMPFFFLEDFCLLVKKEAILAADGFDERFAYVGFEDADFSLRLHRAGYFILRVGVFVHHREGSFAGNGISYSSTWDQNRRFFYEKWGIHPEYSMMVRHDLVKYIDLQRKELRVLDVGCACGSNLMYLKYHAPYAELYGIELEKASATVAGWFGEIFSEDVETLDRKDWLERFDYIILADVIEHLKDPWKTLRQMRDFLKPGGIVIISIPNVLHASNVQNLLRGDWEYRDSGILDRTHLRFFTRRSFSHYLTDAGFSIRRVESRQLRIDYHPFIEKLIKLEEVQVTEEELNAIQWIFVASKDSAGNPPET